MIKPSYDEVLNLKDNYSVIPIYKEIYADAFTPINLLRKIAGKSDKFFLLESIEGGEKWESAVRRGRQESGRRRRCCFI